MTIADYYEISRDKFEKVWDDIYTYREQNQINEIVDLLKFAHRTYDGDKLYVAIYIIGFIKGITTNEHG